MMTKEETAAVLLKNSPPIGVSAATLFGIPLPTIVMVLTMIWLLIQIVGYLYDRYELWKKKRGEK